VGGISADIESTQRVLVIAHHFPPAGGSGSNRALAFARYLPAYGWEPIVLTPGVAWATPRDDHLLTELPPGLRVIRTRSLEPHPPAPQAATDRDGMPDRGQRDLRPNGSRADVPIDRGGGDAAFRSRSGQGNGDAEFPSRGGYRAGDAAFHTGGGEGVGEAEFHSRGGYGAGGGAFRSRGGYGASSAWTRRMGALRSNVGHLKRFPDAHLGWLPFAVAAGRRERYDVAYSSSGPFTSHLVGLILRRLTGRPWVAELRDGWYRWNRAIFPDYPAWRDILERQLESIALRTADRVVLVTDRMAAAFRRQYPTLPASHFTTVPNGFDRAQISGSPAQPAPRGGFDVLHAGALYYGRSLSAFLEAASRLIDSDPEFSRQFKLSLVGTLDASAQAELGHHGLAARTTCFGQLDHVQTIQAMRSADALLLVANTTPGAEATVPGKLFEYLAVGRPVLAIAPKESSTADVLDQTGGGWLAPAGDPAAIACVLQRAFRAYQAALADPGATRPPEAADNLHRMRPDPAQVAHFDRRLLAGDLAAIFNQAVASHTRAARRL
jgi:glycosyltransferase involved in cell wall biosynthesis